MKRLTWLVGPPGAGKTTFTAGLDVPTVEFNALLAPLVQPRRIRKGVLTANAALVPAVRATLLHPENRHLDPTLVVAGLVPEAALFPLTDEEEVWLLLPERGRWEAQLRRRPVERHTYDDYAYAYAWYDRYARWPGRWPVRVVDVAFREELLGVGTE